MALEIARYQIIREEKCKVKLGVPFDNMHLEKDLRGYQEKYILYKNIICVWC